MDCCVWIWIVVFVNQRPSNADGLRASSDRQCCYIRQHHVRGVHETLRRHTHTPMDGEPISGRGRGTLRHPWLTGCLAGEAS